jgi:hypothetical protein
LFKNKKDLRRSIIKKRRIIKEGKNRKEISKKRRYYLKSSF